MCFDKTLSGGTVAQAVEFTQEKDGGGGGSPGARMVKSGTASIFNGFSGSQKSSEKRQKSREFA
jgi:hypothetical protein